MAILVLREALVGGASLMKRIVDRRIGTSGFGEFASSHRSPLGAGVRFVFRNGTAYDVPAVVLRAWRGVARDPGIAKRVPGIRSVRRVWEGKVVRLRWADGIVQDVPWDSVLMGCEPRYEHFGGLTEESRRFTRMAFERLGPFLVDGEIAQKRIACPGVRRPRS